MQQLIEMLMKALNMFGIKADLGALDLPSLLMKAGSIDSLKDELMSQFGSKLGLDGDLAKKVMGGVDLPSLDLDALKNMDLSKLDMSSILGGAGMAGLAGTMMGGMGDKAQDALGGLGSMLGGAKDAAQDATTATVTAGSDAIEGATDMAGNAAEGAQDMASNTMGATTEGIGDMVGNVMGGIKEAEKFASANQGIISKILAFLGIK